MLKIRSGIGYDIHRLKAGDGLFLGGVKVSDQLQFAAHSDGDVLIHSLIGTPICETRSALLKHYQHIARFCDIHHNSWKNREKFT